MIDLDAIERRTYGPGDVMVPAPTFMALVRATRMLVDIFESQPPVLRQIDLDHVAVVVAPFRGPPVEG